MTISRFWNLVKSGSDLLKRFIASLSKSEKSFLLVLILIAIVDGGFLGYRSWITSTQAIPKVGGIYREGIVATSLADIKPTLDRLTKVGFVTFDKQHAILPSAATSWEISADGKTYTFNMAEALARETIESALVQNKNLFPDIAVEVNDQKQVVFKLKQPFSPFLSTTTASIFPVGPFMIDKQDKGIVQLKANEQSLVGKPYLTSIILKTYPDSFNVTQALASGEIDGVANIDHVENEKLIEKLQVQSVKLPRKIFLFFNTLKPQFKSAEIRKKIKNGEALTTPITANLVTLANPHKENLAQEIVQKWESLGVALTINTYTATELATTIIPNRSYDILIYGLDFGSDPDPYPFWHSSQIGQSGLNLSNFAHLDGDRLLEKARQTNNQEERNKLYAQFDAIFADQVPAIELEQVISEFAVDSGLHGVNSHVGTTSADRYQFVTEWFRETKREKVE